ncbi:hypothetical protein [Primorskyibacter sp. 2E233]|uniref:hypothetical protein n=1 Tax=Primorskyibacter sp. 2E233 TaxID=3413431 RepID=UPI003BF233A4
MSGAADQLRQSLRELRAVSDALSGAMDRAEAALETHFEAGVQQPVQPAIEGLPPPCEHRRQHRPGRPAIIDKDPELRAFILARINRLTFPQLEAEVANAFPPERRVKKTAINDWWNKHRDALSPIFQPE